MVNTFEIKTPVIYSNVDGLRDQVADAALLCDLKSPNNLAEHLKNLLDSELCRKDLVLKGNKRLKDLNQNNIIEVLNNILDDYSVKLKCWKF